MVDLVGDSTGGGMVATVTVDGFPYKTLGDAFVLLVQDPQQALSDEKLERLRAELPDVVDAQTVRAPVEAPCTPSRCPSSRSSRRFARYSTAMLRCFGWRCCGRSCRS